MQRGNLNRARELFEQSLLLDREAGERAFFRGEYERHAGLVLMMQGDNESAIPYFERSLEHRKVAGAIDASLFAESVAYSSAAEQTGRELDALAGTDKLSLAAD